MCRMSKVPSGRLQLDRVTRQTRLTRYFGFVINSIVVRLNGCARIIKGQPDDGAEEKIQKEERERPTRKKHPGRKEKVGCGK